MLTGYYTRVEFNAPHPRKSSRHYSNLTKAAA